MTNPPKKRKGLLPALAVAGVSLLLALAAGEVVARIFLRRNWDTEVLRNQLTRVSIRSLIALDDDPELVYALKPGLDAEFQGSRVLTDDSGVRVGSAGANAHGRDVGEPIRVALIGDSTSFGWRVDYEDTFGEKVRSALQTLAGSPVVLRNYSVPGYNASQEYRVFVKTISGFHPQLLIVLHDHNDSQPTGWGYSDWIPPESGDNAFHSALLKLILRRVKKLGQKPAPFPLEGRDECLDGYCVKGPSYDAMMESRRALCQAAHAQGIPALIVIFNANITSEVSPDTSRAYSRLHEALSARFAEMGYVPLDLYPGYQRKLKEAGTQDLRSLWVDAEDRHPNALGHTFIAETILKVIEETPELKRIFSGRR